MSSQRFMLSSKQPKTHILPIFLKIGLDILGGHDNFPLIIPSDSENSMVSLDFQSIVLCSVLVTGKPGSTTSSYTEQAFHLSCGL